MFVRLERFGDLEERDVVELERVDTLDALPVPVSSLGSLAGLNSPASNLTSSPGRVCNNSVEPSRLDAVLS